MKSGVFFRAGCGFVIGLAALPAYAHQTNSAEAAPSPVDEASAPAEQASGVSMTDIVVTARRREERLQDVPVAITIRHAGALNSISRS
jgi:iron complex outermembrane receptor protein